MSAPSFAEPAALAAELAGVAVDAGALVVCTDFDGSLAPITGRPEDSRPLPTADAAVAWLSRPGAARGAGARCATRLAVVSARDSADVVRRMSLGAEAAVSGNYGLELAVDGRVTLEEAAEAWLPALSRAETDLQDRLGRDGCPGAWLERKRFGIVLHTRDAACTDADARRIAGEVAARHGMMVIAGKHVAEVHPPLPRTKADVVQALLSGGWSAAAVCTAGDDVGDIPMLRLAAGRRCGMGVAVADAETPPEVVAAASRAVAGPQAWAVVLERLVEALRVDGG